MTTITKEWLQREITSIESARDDMPFGLDEEQSNTLAALKIALASLEAEASENSVHYLFLRAKAMMYQSGGSPIEHSLNPIDAWLFEAERVAMLQDNSPVIPDGYVMVPKEPTAEMLNAAWVLHGIYHASAYRTMIAAAPQQEAKR